MNFGTFTLESQQQVNITTIEFCLVTEKLLYFLKPFLIELYLSNISLTTFKIILLDWKCNEDYFDMLYVMIGAMGTEISSILG